MSTSNEPLPTPLSTLSSETLPSTETQQPVLSKEKGSTVFILKKLSIENNSLSFLYKVELTIPMTTKEMKEFKEDIPVAFQEESKHTGFMEKLREFFLPR